MPTPYCRHIQTTGRRCASPALQGELYCYFHARIHSRHRVPTAEPDEIVLHPMRGLSAKPDALGQAEPVLAAAAPPKPLVLEFPPLEDRESIQVAASMIVCALGRNLLDGRRAAAMLYGLQVATTVTCNDVEPDQDFIIEVNPLTAPDGTDLAPDEDPEFITSGTHADTKA